MNELEYNIKIDKLNIRIYNLNKEIKEKDKTIEELKKRCIRQSDEIVLLKVALSKGGYYDNNGSKQRNRKN